MTETPTYRDLFRIWAKVGILSFGGPAGQIALMHRIVVDEKRWLTEKDFLAALSFCMLLPGPEAMQLATYSGWRLRGVPGGLIAGLLFVLPGALVMAVLASIYAYWGTSGSMTALFLGVKAAVVVIVIEALLKVSRRALRRRDHWVLAVLAFVGLFVLKLPFPLLIAAAALYGFATGRGEPVAAAPSTPPRTLRTVVVWLAIWWLPMGALWLVAPGSILIAIGLFFAKLAVVTFGGAYAVLAYMAQEVVQSKGWLPPEAMIDGLGLAETTPGPLILVTEFVGHLAAFAAGGVWLALAGALVTLWMTFAPCFLWIFAGAPYIARITGAPRLANALSAVTACVVGVVLNLTIWFALNVFFPGIERIHYGALHLWLPDFAAMDWVAMALTLIAAVLLLWLKRGLLEVLGIMAVLGLGIALLP